MAQGEGGGPDYIALLDAPIMFFLSFSFLLYLNIISYTLHLCMYSCSCSCSFKLFYMALQVNFAGPHKVSLSSLLLPLPFSFFYFSLYPTSKENNQQFSIKIFVSLLS